MTENQQADHVFITSQFLLVNPGKFWWRRAVPELCDAVPISMLMLLVAAALWGHGWRRVACSDPRRARSDGHDLRAEFNGPCRAPAVLLQKHHQLIIDNNLLSRFTIRRAVQLRIINVRSYEDINSRLMQKYPWDCRNESLTTPACSRFRVMLAIWTHVTTL